MDWLAEQTKLRDAALSALRGSTHFRAVEALDAAVVALGGKPVFNSLQALSADSMATVTPASPERSSVRAITGHGTAALGVLENAGRPLPILSLLDKVRESGTDVSGKDPLSNFRSSLSRDTRLRSVGKGNQFVWWFADREFPQGFDEAEPNLLKGLNGSASSVSSKEGGEGHGPATTH